MKALTVDWFRTDFDFYWVNVQLLCEMNRTPSCSYHPSPYYHGNSVYQQTRVWSALARLADVLTLSGDMVILHLHGPNIISIDNVRWCLGWLNAPVHVCIIMCVLYIRGVTTIKATEFAIVGVAVLRKTIFRHNCYYTLDLVFSTFTVDWDTIIFCVNFLANWNAHISNWHKNIRKHTNLQYMQMYSYLVCMIGCITNSASVVLSSWLRHCTYTRGSIF